MRKIYSVIIILALIAGFISCSNGDNKKSERMNKITIPEQIGQQVFGILKNIDFKSEYGNIEFAKNFLSYKEMVDLVGDDRVTRDVNVRDIFASMTDEDWKESIDQLYFNLLSMMILDNIYFDDFKYKDFTYQFVTDNGGGKIVEGKLSITHNDEVYEFASYSVWNGEKYVLTRFEKYNLGGTEAFM